MSERQFEGELNQPRIVHGIVNHVKRRRRIEVRSGAVPARGAKLWMVEQIKELGAQIEPHSFAGQGEMFDDGEIGVYEARTGKGRAVRVSEFSRRPAARSRKR